MCLVGFIGYSVSHHTRQSPSCVYLSLLDFFQSVLIHLPLSSATAGAATTVSLMFFGKENQLILYCHFCVCVCASSRRPRPSHDCWNENGGQKQTRHPLSPPSGWKMPGPAQWWSTVANLAVSHRRVRQFRLLIFSSCVVLLAFSPPSFPPLNLVCLSLVIDDKELWSRCGPSVDDRKGACQTGETKVKTKQSEKSTKPKALVERGGRKRRGGSTTKKIDTPLNGSGGGSSLAVRILYALVVVAV